MSCFVSSVISSVASVAATVMTPIVEKLYQQDITQAGTLCRTANSTLFNSTCWHAGTLVSNTGIVSRCLYVATPALWTACGVSLACNAARRAVQAREKPLTDEEKSSDREGRIWAAVLSLPLAISATAASCLLPFYNAETAAYAYGQECINRTFINITSCEQLSQTALAYNVYGACFLILGGTAWAIFGYSMTSCCISKGQESRED